MTSGDRTDQIQLPSSFIYGVATAAYQIEGAALEDGRTASIWDTFSHTPGKVLNGDTGDIACDHYHRLPSDLDLIQQLNVSAYRFSFSWPRLLPSAGGQVNQAGLDFYDRLIDGCLARNLQPFATLYHWDLPQYVYDKGGWVSRDTALAFADYAKLIADHFGDRLQTVTTFNEPWCSSILSYLYGVHAPGLQDLAQTFSVIHGQHLAHGLAVQAMRSSRPDLPMGIVLNAQAVYPIDSAAADAADRHHRFHNGLFFEPLFQGRYPEQVTEALAPLLPDNIADDLPTIAQPLDFWGLNYYTPTWVANAASADETYPASAIVERENVTRTDIGWEVNADCLTDLLKRLYAEYSLPPCYITENGAAYNHEVEDGKVDDLPRLIYLQQHIQAVAVAISEGIDVKGYFAWSLMDNFEWAEGYSQRFGLVHVDYDTQQRTIKRSGLWYSDLCRQHREQASREQREQGTDHN